MNQKENTIRAFIAVEIPQNIFPFLKKTCENFKSIIKKTNRISWVNIENIHITLKFLGDINIDAIDKIKEAIKITAKQISPFSLKLKEIGVFPSVRKPRVIWLGISENVKKLITLNEILEDNMEKIGFSKEEKQFKAHITMARVKEIKSYEEIANAINSVSAPESESFMCDKLILFQSTLKPTGAIYNKIIVEPLK
ncbi:MAG: RNA 2',3'-cyclic phosphodiesterase [Desulfobacterales bacterium]|nr:RNA 2',3'-cyclic phosphodiesterase [Desulfobacterales bacterium]